MEPTASISDAPEARQALTRALARLAHGQPGGAFWLAGPAGTAGLAEPAWLSEEAGRAGLGHATGVCQGAGGAPYAPWLAVLEALLPTARAEAAAVLAAHGPILQALLPDLGAPPAAALPPASERLRLQGACTAVFRAIAEARGLVLVVEEAQEADPLSLELTAALARLAHEAPLLLVVTSRGLASPIPPERARFERFEVTAEAEAASAEARLQALPTDAVPLARVAALAGSELDEGLLQEASGMPDAAIGLGHLLTAGLLQRRANGRLAFAPAAREAVLARMSEGSRARGHRALALALQGRFGRHAPEEAPLEALTALAHHALASGSADWAIAHALAAGERHARLHALQTAQALFEAALDRLRAQGAAAAPAALCRALGRLGDVHRIAGRYALAKAAYEEAIPLAEGPAASGMWTSLAQAHQGLDQLAAAFTASEKAIATSGGDPAAAARAFLTSARLLVYRGETAEARVRLAHALGLARQAGDGSREGEALAFLGYLRLSAGEGGFDHLHEAIAIQGRLGDEVGLCMSHMILGNAELRQGEYAGAGRSFTEARRLADRLGNPTEGGIAAINLAIVAIERGEPDRALELAGDARTNALALGNKFQFCLAEALVARASAMLGMVGAARQSIAQAQRVVHELGNAYLESLVLPDVAEVLLWLGEPDKARVVAEAALAAAGEPDAAIRARLLAAEAAWRLGAAAGLAMAEATASEAADRQLHGLHLRAMRLIAALAEGERAKAVAAAGLIQARGLGCRLIEAELHGQLAGLADSPEDGLAHARQMAAIARTAGAAWHQVLALSIEARLAGDPVLATTARQQATGLVAGLDDAVRSRFFRYPDRQALAVPGLVAPE